jgi:hypothetical protein
MESVADKNNLVTSSILSTSVASVAIVILKKIKDKR